MLDLTGVESSLRFRNSTASNTVSDPSKCVLGVIFTYFIIIQYVNPFLHSETTIITKLSIEMRYNQPVLPVLEIFLSHVVYMLVSKCANFKRMFSFPNRIRLESEVVPASFSASRVRCRQPTDCQQASPTISLDKIRVTHTNKI